MFLLKLVQGDLLQSVGLFDSLEEGREFLGEVPGYDCQLVGDEAVESLDAAALPPYGEFPFHGHVVPLSRSLFALGPVEIVWEELANLSSEGRGIPVGAFNIAGYSVDFREMEDYIRSREAKYHELSQYLEGRGYELFRAYGGEQDGEVVYYRRDGEEHFLIHMDPLFPQLRIPEDVEALLP
ncbi:MAG: hypothetical protein Q4E76_05740 [Tissierellia bacterium]|nr:hypothetical protein [Tissierellia bacterium]